jgi:hypothetical protein
MKHHTHAFPHVIFAPLPANAQKFLLMWRRVFFIELVSGVADENQDQQTDPRYVDDHARQTLFDVDLKPNPVFLQPGTGEIKANREQLLQRHSAPWPIALAGKAHKAFYDTGDPFSF